MLAAQGRFPGFTLIELAVVIAITTILAAVAIIRVVDTNIPAEAGVLRDFKTKLLSGAAMYTARQGTPPPNGFSDYVTNGSIQPGDSYTISAGAMTNKSTNQPACTVANTPMVCTLSRWSATYTYAPDSGLITASMTPVGTNTQPAVPSF